MEERGGGRPAVAWAVWALAWGLALAAVGLLLAVPSDAFATAPFFADPAYFVLDVVMALLNAPAAALLIARSRHLVGWLAGLVAVGFGAAACSLAWALVAFESPGLPGAGLAAHAFTWLWVPGAFAAVTVMPWYLRRDRPPPIARALALLGALATAVVTINVMTAQQAGAPANPLALDGAAAAVMRPAGSAALLAAALLGVIGAASLVGRWRREDETGRRALLMIAGALAMVVASFAALTYWPPGAARGLVDAVAVPVLFGAQVMMPVAILLLVLGSRFWGVDVVVSRATLGLLLTTAVVLLYVAAVWLLGSVLPVSDQLAGLLAAAALALAVQPVRSALQRYVDRLVYGSHSDPVALLAKLGEQLRDVAREDALPGLAASILHGLSLGGVRITGTGEPPMSVTAGRLDAAGEDRRVTLPLVVDRREIGELTVEAPAGQRLDLRTIRVIRRLADVVAVSLDLAQTNQRLQAASERLGEVRHEERRMLRRELHDGMGPALAGVGLGLAAARRRLLHDPEGTAELLAELEAELARRTDDVRLLARSLLPAQLDEGDLPAALEVMAARFRESGLQVRVHAAHECEIETRRQIALYHVAAEALLNAHRHAGATTVEVALVGDADGTTLDVVDDGVGLTDAPRRGVGLTSMRERADEFGGRLEIGPGHQGRGTRVRMVLP